MVFWYWFCFKDHQGCVTPGYWWCKGLTNYSIHVDQISFVTFKLSFLTEYPRIESSPQVRNPYNVGEQLNLACIAKGKPAPKINWIKNGRIIPKETARFYHINEVSVSDAGVYSCRASNQLGSVTSLGVHVHVQCKYFLILSFVFKRVLSMANFLFEDAPAVIMVVVFIVLDWMLVLMNTITVIPCKRVLYRQLRKR